MGPLLGAVAGLAGCNVGQAYQDVCARYGPCELTSGAASSSSGASGSTAGPAASESDSVADGSDAAGSGSTDADTAAAEAGDGEASEASGSSGTSGAQTSGVAAFCGDGKVDPGEECDSVETTCNAACVASRIIFVTSEPLMAAGDIDGLDGANFECRKRAAAQGLANHDRYRAWLSTSLFNAADRVEHHKGRYILVTGEVVAEDFEALTSGTLQVPVQRTEKGEILNTPVWTGTASDGQRVQGISLCTDWTDSEVIDFEAIAGSSSYADAKWTNDVTQNPSPCDGPGALYCIEQP